jgi:aminotransferase
MGHDAPMTTTKQPTTMATLPASRVSRKAASFTESVIREMTRIALEHNAVNLAQGFPDFACPTEIKDAASAAIYADVNQYAITWGAKDFRDAIAAKTQRFYPTWSVDPQTNITVTCGATEGMIAVMLALLDPGDEVVVFEPFYENYRSEVRDPARAGLVDRLRGAAGGFRAPNPRGGA